MKLPWRDPQRFAATYLLDDLVGLHRCGTEALLQERVAGLSDGGRRVLRAALDTARPDSPRDYAETTFDQPLTCARQAA
jgi:hypothetical protein